MTRIICPCCDSVNYVDETQDIYSVVCRDCGNHLDEPRPDPTFSCDDVLNAIVAVSKDTMHGMDFTGMEFCDVVHEIADRLNEEHC